MNRWTRPLLAALALASAASASAQTSPPLQREVPRDVQAARLVITTPPEARLDGQPARLSPGARIRDTRNLLVLSGTLAGQELPVLYRRDTTGALHELWLLTEAEFTALGGSTGEASPGVQREFGERLVRLIGVRQ